MRIICAEGRQENQMYNQLHYIPVILQVADALALLLGPSLGLAPSGPQLAAFNSAPGRVVTHPSHLLM
ncbi:hypothetical protein CWD78_16500 [Dickeya dadantii]|nr:hypothetical protein [Dickeya dadantii]